MKNFGRNALVGAGFVATLSLAGCDAGREPAAVAEFAIDYAQKGQPIVLGKHCSAIPAGAMAHGGSTHEIEPHGGVMWISGQNHDSLVRVTPAGGGTPKMDYFALPAGSGPHGMAFDAAGLLWLTLEYKGCIIALDGNRVVAAHDVALAYDASPDESGTRPQETNSHPHGLGIGPDGKTIWFTGKASGTVGRIAPDGKLATFALPTAGSTPIYVKAGPDGNMWVTELTGNAIARVTPAGEVTEYRIPTANSRPIAIIPGPDGAMWFSQEAGSKVARIAMDGTITEFAVPRAQPNHILAGLAFDRDGDLWVQQYVDRNNPSPPGSDRIVRIAKAGLAGAPADLSARHFTFFPVPTRGTIMHRIVQGPDHNLWFTEMAADKVGRVVARPGRP